MHIKDADNRLEPAKSTKFILPTRLVSEFRDDTYTIKPLWLLRGSSVGIFWAGLREPNPLKYNL